MEFNKIAGAILLTALAAMVVSKVGDILIPEEHYVVQQEVDQPEKTAPEPEEKDPPVGQALAKADPAKGEALVKARCGSCHTWDKGGPNRVGPNIYGVVGADKGSKEGYDYSSAMANAPGDWTYEQLYAYLDNPQAVVKGTKMAFQLRKWDQRAHVIAYLRTQHDNPPPLPEPEPEPAKTTDPSKTEDPAKKGDETKQAPGKTPEANKTDPAKPAPDQTAPENKSQPETKPQPENKTQPENQPEPENKTAPNQAEPEKKTEAPRDANKPSEAPKANPTETEPSENRPAETKPAEPTPERAPSETKPAEPESDE